MITCSNASGRLGLTDRQRDKPQVDRTRNVILPACRADGSRIASLEKSGKKKYDLLVVEVRP
jgi:hypothetical protein